jgi:FolB domain-containing protein
VTRAREAPPTVITIDGIRASGRHGANPGEQLEAQDFVVDVSAAVGTGEDALDQTVDYREIVEAVKAVVAENSFALLETMAEVLVDSIVSLGRVDWATVVVHKPAAATSLGVEDVSAEATYEPS